MQGRADPQREILDVESVAGHLLPAGGVFAFLAGHRHVLFPEAMFADLFKPGGRPSIPAELAATRTWRRRGLVSGRPVLVLAVITGREEASAVVDFVVSDQEQLLVGDPLPA